MPLGRLRDNPTPKCPGSPGTLRP